MNSTTTTIRARIAARHRRVPLAAALALAFAPAAWPIAAHAQTLPAAPSVVYGNAAFARPSAGQLTVNQASQKAIINWQSFSIGANGKVVFNQPNAQSVALNRVVGTDPSAIFGSLSANGRVFLVTAVGLSLSGLYMVWVRGANPSIVGKVSTSLNALLILVFAALAWRAALRRDVSVHRRWALRLYLVANAQWFIRVGVFAWFLLNRAVGVKAGFSGPFFYFADFACYLLPLAVLELYLYAQHKAGPGGRFAMAGGLVVLTALMAVGMFGFSMFSLRILAKV